MRLGQNNAAALAVAASLAGRFGAYVEGMAIHQPPPLTSAPFYLSSDLLAAERRRVEAEITAAEAEFRAAMQGQAAGVDWFAAVTEETIAATLARHARATDLLITAADEPHGASESPSPLQLGDLITLAGRPILIVPARGAKVPLDHALIAWKDGTPARRAIADSLGLLHKARRVSLVEIVPQAEAETARTRLALVAGWLARHKITAEPRVFTTLGEDAERLHLLAREEKVDLVVAGGYAHHRVREWIFGGVTRTLLSQDERCVLLSH
jgi:nucleotide-binding universal stress UspA family protein